MSIDSTAALSMVSAKPTQARAREAGLPWGLALLCAALWIVIGLFGHQPYKPDEAYTVGLVKSMVESGGWVVPRLVGEPFMEKPPLFYAVAALFAELLPELPLHEAARLAVVLFVAIGLFAIAACAREIHGKGSGRLAVLLALATVGTVVRLHQLITDVALFAGIAIGLLGLVLAPRRPQAGGFLLGAGLAVAFLSKGLLGPGMILCTALALLVLTPWPLSSFATTAALALSIAIPAAALWLAPLALRAPEQLHVWFYDNNIGRFLGLNSLGPKKDVFFYAGTLVWYALPCWPLAIWGWVRGAGTGQAFRATPALVLFCIGVTVLSLASDGRELYALPLVPALSFAATGGLLALPIHVERWLALGLGGLMVVVAAALMGLWGAAMRTPGLTAALPPVASMPHMVAPTPMAMAFHAVVAFALAAMLTTLRRPFRGALPLAGAAGLALVWTSLMLPWGAYLDELKGYRSLALSVRDHLPGTGCVASVGFGEGERALLDYFVGLRTERIDALDSASGCQTLLVQAAAGKRPDVGLGWTLSWEGSRTGIDTSVLRLYIK